MGLRNRCACYVPIFVTRRLDYTAQCRLNPGHDGAHEANGWPYIDGIIAWGPGAPTAHEPNWFPAVR